MLLCIGRKLKLLSVDPIGNKISAKLPLGIHGKVTKPNPIPFFKSATFMSLDWLFGSLNYYDRLDDLIGVLLTPGGVPYHIVNLL